MRFLVVCALVALMSAFVASTASAQCPNGRCQPGYTILPPSSGIGAIAYAPPGQSAEPPLIKPTPAPAPAKASKPHPFRFPKLHPFRCRH